MDHEKSHSLVCYHAHACIIKRRGAESDRLPHSIKITALVTALLSVESRSSTFSGIKVTAFPFKSKTVGTIMAGDIRLFPKRL